MNVVYFITYQKRQPQYLAVCQCVARHGPYANVAQIPPQCQDCEQRALVQARNVFCDSALLSHSHTFGFIAGLGLLTARRVKDITFPSSWRPAQTASPFSRLLSRDKQLLCTLFFLLWGVYDCAVGPTRVTTSAGLQLVAEPRSV
jgi:hypothetical protein